MSEVRPNSPVDFHHSRLQPWWQSAEESSAQNQGSHLGWASAQSHLDSGKLRSRAVSLPIALVMALAAGAIGAGLSQNWGGSSSTQLVTSQSTVERKPDSVSGVAARVLPSVVSIMVATNSGGDSGSGFFIRSDGYIVTNNHVISAAVGGAGRITVSLQNGKNYSATLIGRDVSYDLAVLKIAVTDAPALQLGDSSKVQVGDTVIAIGSPLGLAGTVTSGIISAKNRAVTAGDGSTESSFINALQTDAAINPGNSGGPLVDLTGAVIGVNSAIASLGSSALSQSGSIGLGFAIPINQAKKTAEELIATGKSTYPIIGVSVDSAYSGVGARIAMTAGAVRPNSPAAKAGLRAGDIITEFDGKPIQNSDELIVAIRSHSVGDKVTLTIKRGASTFKRTLSLVAASS